MFKRICCFTGVLLLVAGNFVIGAHGAGLETVQNSPLSVPCAKVASLVGPTQLAGSNFMVSAVTPTTLKGGRASLVNSQQWVRHYNSGIGLQNTLSRMVVRNDGSIVLTGYAQTHTAGSDFATLCYSADGSLLWTNRHDGAGHGNDYARLLAANASGEVWVVGDSIRYSTNSLLTDVAVIKYASNGIPAWTNRYSSFDTNVAYPTGLVVDDAGNAYVAQWGSFWSSGSGSPVEDALIKYDALGNIVWTKHYLYLAPDSGQGLHILGPMALDDSGNLFVAGSSGRPHYDTGSSIVKFAGDGTALWTNHLSLQVMSATRALSVDRQGNAILTGETRSNQTTVYVTVKCSKDGNMLWTNVLAGPAYNGGYVPQTVPDLAGNVFIIGGSAGVSHNSGLYQILKLNNDGVPLWTNQISVFGATNGMFYDSVVDNTGNLFLTGKALTPEAKYSDFVTVKYSGNGQPLWTNRYEGNFGDDVPFALAVDGTGNVYVTGRSSSLPGVLGSATVKYADSLSYTPAQDFIGSDTITFVLTDSFGNSATGSVEVVVTPAVEFKYTTNNNGGITITGYTGLGGAVSIPEMINGLPVDSIGTCASGFTNITSLSIPGSVKRVGESSFAYCTNLTNVTIADGVTSIAGAFWKCTKLSNITIPNSVTNISGAFDECTSLSSITIPDGVTKIGPYTFNQCTSLTNVIIPDSVQMIEEYAFSSCSNLAQLTVPDSVTSIGENSFSYCTKLASITIPTGVTHICDDTFSHCTSLSSITIPNSVIVIRARAFSSCSSLTNLTIPNTVDYIEENAFSFCTSLSSIVVPEGVKDLGSFAFYSCTNLSSVTLPDSDIDIWFGAFASCSRLTSIRIPRSVTVLRNQVFENCASLTSVIIPDTVTAIGSAFSGCTSLTNMVIPSSVTHIGDKAFYSCTSLINVTIPSSVGWIGNDAFSYCTKLPCVTIPNSVTNVGNYAFYACGSLTTFTIPDSVTSLGASAFNGCWMLTSVTIPDSVTNIGGHAFGYCTSLPSITIPNSVNTMGEGVFYCCSSLTNITMPNNLTIIEEGTFYMCSNLTCITIPSSVAKIGDWAFSECARLAGVYFQGNAPSIGYDAFFNSKNAMVYYLPGTTGWSTTFCGRPARSGGLNVTRQPHDLSLVHGIDATFRVSADKQKCLFYQWLKDGVALEDGPEISGTRSDALVIRKVRLEDQGFYSVIISNTLSVITSRSAELRVTADDPKLEIVNPTNVRRLSNAMVSVSGKASDRLGIGSIRVRANEGQWVAASITNNNWFANLVMDAPGTNWIVVQAEDLEGVTHSLSNKVIYVLSDQLTLEKTGSGRISPNHNNALLEIGKAYTVTAWPGSGYVFSNWTGGIFPESGILTNSPRLCFVMQSNLFLRANFIPNPFSRAAGSYAGLFYSTNQDGLTVTNTGYFTAQVRSGGAFSAKIKQGAKCYSFSGQFAVDGSWETTLIKGAPGLSASLHLDLNARDKITGKISNGVWESEVFAYRAVYSRTNRSPLAAKYTLVIPGSADAANLPGGHGTLALNVSPLGVITACGTLGDGEPVTAGTFALGFGRCPLYIAPYAKGGLFVGWLRFINNSNDLKGIVAWIKPGQTSSKFYPDGFESPYGGITNSVFGSAFTNKSLLLNGTNGVVILENGNLAQSVTNCFSMSVGNKVTATNGLTLTFKTTGVTAGLFSGSAVVIPGAKTSTIHGAILQNQNIGCGWFLGTNQSGAVRLMLE